jgi:hypothetical protein
MMAPVATFLERRVDVRLLLATGYTLFAVGLIGNGFMTFETDFWGLFWKQLVRGAAVMLCLLPSTVLALSGFASDRVPNASGLFNLMRNLGGAIGLALIDTVLEQRTPTHIASLVGRLQAGDAAAARLMLCLLPSTVLALSGFASDQVPNASGLFNLMRNLGGAIGLALIDTVLERRTPTHIASLVGRLQAGDAAAARLVSLPTERARRCVRRCLAADRRFGGMFTAASFGTNAVAIRHFKLARSMHEQTTYLECARCNSRIGCNLERADEPMQIHSGGLSAVIG